MLARLQQISTLGLLAALVAWVVHFLQRDEPGWAWAGGVLIAFGYALFLALEFVFVGIVQDGNAAPRAAVAQLIRAWWGEVLTTPRVFFWRGPFRTSAEPDFLPPDGYGRRGVVLVHGFFCNRAVWNPWMRKLRQAGTPFMAVTLEPVFGSIDQYADTIDDAVTRLHAATGMPPVLVAHSMGGLAVRAWLAARQADARVHHTITIGTPHHGTWLARFGHAHNGKQMRVDCDWLAQLSAGETPQRAARFTCFYSHCDNIVFPAWRATLPGADNRHVVGSAHVQLAFNPVVMDEALRWTGTVAAAAQAGRDTESAV